MNHRVCLHRSVRCLLPPELYTSIFPVQGNGDALGWHQAAARPSPQITGPLLLHPLPTGKRHGCIDPCLCRCYGRHQESGQSEPKLNIFHRKVSFRSTAAGARCRKPAPAGERSGVRPTGQRNLPNALHPPPVLRPFPSPSGAEGIAAEAPERPWGGGRQHPPGGGWSGAGERPQPQRHAPKPLSGAKRCHRPIRRLKRAHAPNAHLEA